MIIATRYLYLDIYVDIYIDMMNSDLAAIQVQSLMNIQQICDQIMEKERQRQRSTERQQQRSTDFSCQNCGVAMENGGLCRRCVDLPCCKFCRRHLPPYCFDHVEDRICQACARKRSRPRVTRAVDEVISEVDVPVNVQHTNCLLYTSDAADE